MERLVLHSHENKNLYLFKIAIHEKCQKPTLTVQAIMIAIATNFKVLAFPVMKE